MATLTKWSVGDYHRMIEAGILSDRRVELLSGDIVEMSPEGAAHYMLGEDGSEYLKTLLQGKAYVRFDGPVTLANSEPEPDIAVVCLPRENYRQRHPYPQDILLIIEISDSTLKIDLHQKKKIYAKANIQEYWVLDLNARQLTVFREPKNGDYILKREMTQGIITMLAFPDIEISVTKLLNPV